MITRIFYDKIVIEGIRSMVVNTEEVDEGLFLFDVQTPHVSFLVNTGKIYGDNGTLIFERPMALSIKTQAYACEGYWEIED